MSDLGHRFEALKNIFNAFDALLSYLSLANEQLEIKTKILVKKYKFKKWYLKNL